MMLKVPRKSRPMYCTVGSAELLTPGWGPLGLALEIVPLPLATSRCLPSGVTRTDVGYQPTGMKPSERLLPNSETSKMATALIFALATNRVFSSGESARLLGVEPGGELGCNSATRVSIGRPVAVSRTLTVLRLALTTNKWLPERVSAISFGCSSVGHWATTAGLVKSITATAACAQRLT